MTTLNINFHGLGEPPSWIDADERPYWLSPQVFETALDLMIASKRPFEVTFDDGNESDFVLARPLLKERDLTAGFFICSGRIGKPGYLDAERIQSLAADGFEIGTHGCDHLPWKGANADLLEREIRGSKQTLERLLGQPVASAAIPFGMYDGAVIRKLREAGFAKIYSSDRFPTHFNRTLIPRYSVRKDRDIADQIAELLQGMSPLSRIRQDLRVAVKAIR